jgi:HK97 family phage portal protein
MIRELRAWWTGLRSSWSGPWLSSDAGLATVWGGGTTSAGVAVSEASSLTQSAVWAAVQCIAGDVASLPFFHYKKTATGGKTRAEDTRLYKVLHDEFNSEMSAMLGRETLTEHALLWGNGYAEIQRNDLGQVVALWPLTPDRVMPTRPKPFGPIVYKVSRADGTQVTIGAESLFHLVGLGYDGLQGYPVIQKAREAMGVSIAAERLAAATFANGTSYSGFFQHPRALGATALQHLKDSLAKDKPGGYRILEEGMTFQAGSMPLRDAQWLETRKFQVTDVARWFGIPPHKLGDLERATFSNIEEQNIDYVVGTLRRWLVRWEQECNRKLIPALERRQQFCEHLVDGLLRGNIQSRYTAYSVGRNGGWLSANDIRTFENQDPIPGGDVYLIQGAMVPLDRVNDIVDAQVGAGTGAAESAAPGDQGSPPATPAPADQTNSQVVDALVADLKAEVAQRNAAFTTELTQHQAALLEAQQTHQAALVARLASDQAIRAVQQGTLALVAARFVRRELAQLKKWAAAPDELPTRLATFYQRVVPETCAELQPLLRHWRPDGEAALRTTLEGWATAAQADTCHALGNGGVESLAVGREEALTQRLWEACHA